jgi:hypothetical protein
MRLSIAPPLADEPTTIPVFVVVGRWRAEKLAALVGEKAAGGGRGADGSDQQPQLSESLPKRFPGEVLLLVGQSDLFPYRIEYRRVAEQAPGGGAASYQLSAHPMVVMALSDVAFDVPIAAGQFDYTPGDADWVDQTAQYRERLLRRHRQEMAAQGGGIAVPISR